MEENPAERSPEQVAEFPQVIEANVTAGNRSDVIRRVGHKEGAG
jgi:hypothetical protein